MTRRFGCELCQVCGEAIAATDEPHSTDDGDVHPECCWWCAAERGDVEWVDAPPRQVNVNVKGDLL